MEDWDADCISVTKSLTCLVSPPHTAVNRNSELKTASSNLLKFDEIEPTSGEPDSRAIEQLSDTVDQESFEMENKDSPQLHTHRPYTMVADNKNKIFVSNISFNVRNVLSF